ncbi:MAG: winged helix-turn-helix domain-containing protein [Candidatus Thermoplasmatota archaeon]
MPMNAVPASPVPESVQTIVSQLSGHKPMTGKEIREATGLPRRTVYTALRRLREMGLLKEAPSLRDTRQTYFWVEGDAANWVPQTA